MAEEAQIFYAVTAEGVVEVEVYLDERLQDKLNLEEPGAWIGLIEFIKDDLALRGSS